MAQGVILDVVKPSPDMRNITCVITALNEDKTIGDLVRDLKDRQIGRVIVVDDGSTDSTGFQAKEAGAEVITHRSPWGIGKSLLHAWGHALRGDRVEWIVQMDAGGSHMPIFLSAMVNYAATNSLDLVVGERFRNGVYVGGKLSRKLGSKMYAWACNFMQHGSLITLIGLLAIESFRAMDFLFYLSLAI